MQSNSKQSSHSTGKTKQTVVMAVAVSALVLLYYTARCILLRGQNVTFVGYLLFSYRLKSFSVGNGLAPRSYAFHSIAICVILFSFSSDLSIHAFGEECKCCCISMVFKVIHQIRFNSTVTLALGLQVIAGACENTIFSQPYVTGVFYEWTNKRLTCISHGLNLLLFNLYISPEDIES